MIQLGSVVRDTITGYEGTVTGRAEYLFGCVRCLVEANGLKDDGAPKGELWIDEQRLVTVSPAAVAASPESAAVTGGPREDAARRGDCPRR